MSKGKWNPQQRRHIKSVGKKIENFIADDLNTQYAQQQRESDHDNDKRYRTISEWLEGKTDD